MRDGAIRQNTVATYHESMLDAAAYYYTCGSCNAVAKASTRHAPLPSPPHKNISRKAEELQPHACSRAHWCLTYTSLFPLLPHLPPPTAAFDPHLPAGPWPHCFSSRALNLQAPFPPPLLPTSLLKHSQIRTHTPSFTEPGGMPCTHALVHKGTRRRRDTSLLLSLAPPHARADQHLGRLDLSQHLPCAPARVGSRSVTFGGRLVTPVPVTTSPSGHVHINACPCLP